MRAVCVFAESSLGAGPRTLFAFRQGGFSDFKVLERVRVLELRPE